MRYTRCRQSRNPGCQGLTPTRGSDCSFARESRSPSSGKINSTVNNLYGEMKKRIKDSEVIVYGSGRHNIDDYMPDRRVNEALAFL